MTRFTRHVAPFGAIVLLIGAGAASAQTVTGSAGASSGYPGASITPGHAITNYQTVRHPNQRPAFHMFGIPVVVSAPVDAPYNSASAYSTYHGQPGFGPNAVLAASVGGQAP